MKKALNKVKFLVGAIIACHAIMISNAARATDPVLVNCVETPGINDMTGERKPTEFGLTNNLIRSTGSPVTADGNVVYVVGRVTDAQCHPVSNVNVFIWQADSRGIYSGNPGYDDNFLGSGKATTDNLGNFGFITVMPGRHMNSDPRIHFLIKHPAFPDFQTEMFFEGMGSSGSSHFSRIPSAMKRLLTARYTGSDNGASIYEFNLTFAYSVSSDDEQHHE